MTILFFRLPDGSHSGYDVPTALDELPAAASDGRLHFAAAAADDAAADSLRFEVSLRIVSFANVSGYITPVDRCP